MNYKAGGKASHPTIVEDSDEERPHAFEMEGSMNMIGRKSRKDRKSKQIFDPN